MIFGSVVGWLFFVTDIQDGYQAQRQVNLNFRLPSLVAWFSLYLLATFLHGLLDPPLVSPWFFVG